MRGVAISNMFSNISTYFVYFLTVSIPRKIQEKDQHIRFIKYYLINAFIIIAVNLTSKQITMYNLENNKHFYEWKTFVLVLLY